jgi:signal transduction histidine kinase
MDPIFRIIPLLSSVFVFCLGIFVIFKYLSNKKEIHLVLSLFCFSITIWLFGTYMMFISVTDIDAIFWDRFVYAGVVFIPALMFHFALAFTNNVNLRKVLPYAYVASFAFLILSQTNVFTSGLFRYQWGAHTEARLFHHLFMVYLVIFTTAFFPIVWKHYRQKLSDIDRNQTRFVFLAFFLLYSIGILAFLPAYRIPIPPIPFFSGLFFIIILSYAILKHKLLDVKAASAAFFTFANLIILFIDIFLAKSTNELIFRILAFIVMVAVGYLLIKSVQREIEQKEKIQTLAKDLREANVHLKELDKTKDDFLSMASHELNTPIAAIEGYLSMILVEGLGGKIPDKARKYLDSVFQSSQRLAHLVKDLLNVSRIESDRIHIIYEECQIVDLINQAIMEIGSKVQEKHHTLIFKQAEAKMPTTWLDKTRITEVLINIIGNSVKYTPEHGTIEVKVVHDDDKLVVSVSDNGKGIPNNRNDAVFQKFTQVDVLKDEVKGTGLGMYISKRFIELHKGKIWFHSDGADKGTTFFFSLPIYAKKPYDPFDGEGSVLH